LKASSPSGLDATWLLWAAAHPHEFTIQYPPRREYFQQHFKRAPGQEASEESLFSGHREMLLYLHVPFCEAKCHYCNFAVDTRSGNVVESYVAALLNELSQKTGLLEDKIVHGIDIGGGTPTRLSISQLQRIMHALKRYRATSSHPFPTSVETTPSIAADEPEKLAMLAANGVDRISMGVQSFNQESLTLVNRTKQIEKCTQAMQHLRAAQFKRVNLDLIFGMPHQSQSDWEYDLAQIIGLSPDSITTYDCLYRGKGRALTKKTEALPSREHYGALYDLGFERLKAAGYHAPYGSVNFSKHPDETGTSANFEARLLDGKAYLGLGNYASSWADDAWYFRKYRVNDYIDTIEGEKSAIGDFYRLPPEEQWAKYILYSLNFGFIDKHRFEARFHSRLIDLFESEIQYLEKKRWMLQDETSHTLASGAFQNLHLVRALFYSRNAQRWLMALAPEKTDWAI
jgi:oxygen-independent coproporphyrinogen III oxidase